MLLVRDVMTTSVITVAPATPLREVARVLADNRISGVPVVDAEGRVLGVVSEADFIAKASGPDAVHHRPLEWLLGESAETVSAEHKLHAVTAADAMTTPAVTVDGRRALSDAAAIMAEHRINRLPVVDDDRLVGIVTRADVVRAYVRTDEQLESIIREDVLLRTMWLDPARFTVAVHDGVASVAGQVDYRSTAQILERSIAMVPGIVRVDATITWARDDDRIEPTWVDPVFPYSPQ